MKINPGDLFLHNGTVLEVEKVVTGLEGLGLSYAETKCLLKLINSEEIVVFTNGWKPDISVVKSMARIKGALAREIYGD